MGFYNAGAINNNTFQVIVLRNDCFTLWSLFLNEKKKQKKTKNKKQKQKKQNKKLWRFHKNII